MVPSYSCLIHEGGKFMARAKTIKKAGSAAEAPQKKKDNLKGEPREYSASEIFEEGDFVYHKIWDDTGEVVEVGTTDDGVRKMKVNFEKLGIKNLRMG